MNPDRILGIHLKPSLNYIYLEINHPNLFQMLKLLTKQHLYQK